MDPTSYLNFDVTERSAFRVSHRERVLKVQAYTCMLKENTLEYYSLKKEYALPYYLYEGLYSVALKLLLLLFIINIIIIFVLVLHSHCLKISKSKSLEWLRWGLGTCERVGKAHCIETLNCH